MKISGGIGGGRGTSINSKEGLPARGREYAGAGRKRRTWKSGKNDSGQKKAGCLDRRRSFAKE